jgi:hypothetical protein
MADFTPVALGIKPQQGMSLGEMLNFAQNAQQYQQTQQMNPLALQKAQMEVEQLQQTNPLAVRQKTAEANTAEITTKQKGLELNTAQTEKLYGLAGGVLNDPRLKSKDPHDVMGAIYEAKQRASTYGIPKETVEGVFNPLFETAKTNPANVQQQINNFVQSRLTPESQTSLQMGGTVEINGVKYQYAPASGRLNPIGGEPTPPATPATPAATTGGQAKPSTSGLVKQDMPVASGGIPQMNTQQTARYEEGQTIQIESTSLALAAQEAKQTSRKIKELPFPDSFEIKVKRLRRNFSSVRGAAYRG